MDSKIGREARNNNSSSWDEVPQKSSRSKKIDERSGKDIRKQIRTTSAKEIIQENKLSLFGHLRMREEKRNKGEHWNSANEMAENRKKW